MFDANKGFFYLVFANTDDCFFTESYVKMDFESTIKMHLLENDYRNICLFGRAPISCDYTYRLDYRGSAYVNPLSFIKKKMKWPFDVKHKYTANIEERNEPNGVKRVRAEFNSSLLSEILQYMFEVMESERDIAVVCPLKIWAECCGDDSFLKKLTACRSRSTHNIVVLTSSVDASENDVYFRNPAYELNATAEAAEPFFFNEKLFPHMVSKPRPRK